MSRAPVHRPEWERAVFTSPLKLSAKAVVLLVGSYMNWRGGSGTNAYPGVARIESDLGSQVGESAIEKYLSAAVRHGLLVVTSDPSPGRACVYRAGVPTGEPAAAAGTLPLDVGSPGDEGLHTSTPVRVMASNASTDSFEHPHARAFEHPHIRPPYPSRSSREDPLPPKPPAPTDRPLLAVVASEPGGRTPAVVGALTEVVIPRHVELVAAGLVAALPDELPSRVVRRWERRVAVQVSRLLALGWETGDLVDEVIRPSWSGVANPGAVLVSRLQSLAPRPPAAAPTKPACGECDLNRQREDSTGRMFRCPSCHPLATAVAPF
jgi:hypothetical protein